MLFLAENYEAYSVFRTVSIGAKVRGAVVGHSKHFLAHQPIPQECSIVIWIWDKGCCVEESIVPSN